MGMNPFLRPADLARTSNNASLAERMVKTVLRNDLLWMPLPIVPG